MCHIPNFMVLYESHIRPIMDFGSSVWNVGYLGDIRLLESVQRRWTRHIADISHLGYEDIESIRDVLYFWEVATG